MAEDAVNEAIKVFDLQPKPSSSLPDISGFGLKHLAAMDGSCQTHDVLLVGAHGFSNTLFIDLIQNFGLDSDVARHLARSYGDRAWEVARLASSSKENNAVARLAPTYPYLTSEIHYAVHNEYALTAADFLSRRTRLAFVDTRAALRALPKVIDLMGRELQWDSARMEAEWTATVKFLGSMGLPESLAAVTREQVVRGEVDVPARIREYILSFFSFLFVLNVYLTD